MKNVTSTNDPILDELHAIRRQLHDESHGNLSKLVDEMRKKEADSNHPIVSVPVSIPAGSQLNEK